ncbi:hypothetical protein QQ045_031544 [Rhodiola kirilowii]
MSRLQLTSTASSKVASLDQKIGFTEKLSVGTTIVNDKVKEMDEKFQVSEKTNNAFAAAEQTVSSAGSAIMKNRYILTGASWVTGAFCRVAKAAEEVGQKAKKKHLHLRSCMRAKGSHLRSCIRQNDRTSDRVSDRTSDRTSDRVSDRTSDRERQATDRTFDRVSEQNAFDRF